jgi:hypothetical protein
VGFLPGGIIAISAYPIKKQAKEHIVIARPGSVVAGDSSQFCVRSGYRQFGAELLTALADLPGRAHDVALQAERKAARDARYAACKARPRR